MNTLPIDVTTTTHCDRCHHYADQDHAGSGAGVTLVAEDEIVACIS